MRVRPVPSPRPGLPPPPSSWPAPPPRRPENREGRGDGSEAGVYVMTEYRVHNAKGPKNV